MKAHEIQPGDRLEEGPATYAVIKVMHGDPVMDGVQVLVQYDADSGTEVRVFEYDQDVPLVRG